MAPLFNILIQLLPNIAGTSDLTNRQPTFREINQQQQHPVGLTNPDDFKGIAKSSSAATISTVAWGSNRLDVFGLAENNITHKFWDGNQWLPSGNQLETLGNGLATPPVAVSWGVNRLDIFGLDDNNVIKHQYWDGGNWQPSVSTLENLGGACDSSHPIAANTWGKNRLDVFCTGSGGDLLHQYYDGSNWQPSVGSLESLGGSLTSGPSVINWGENRFDIFGINSNNDVVHLYWDGYQWSTWETFAFRTPNSNFQNIPPTVTSWGKNRLDIYAVGIDTILYHKYWDGSQWADWESLGGQGIEGSVAATSWSANRLDIVAKIGNDNYFYKYYDGQAWRPDVGGWYNKGPDFHFISSPSAVSWGDNRLDIFGVNGNLYHQAWTSSSWYPSNADWEILADGLEFVNRGVSDLYGSGRCETELRK